MQTQAPGGGGTPIVTCAPCATAKTGNGHFFHSGDYQSIQGVENIKIFLKRYQNCYNGYAKRVGKSLPDLNNEIWCKKENLYLHYLLQYFSKSRRHTWCTGHNHIDNGHIFKVGTQLCNITNFERFTLFFTFVHITQKVVITTLSNYMKKGYKV